MASTTTSNKPWLKSYPKGMPPEINPAQYENLVELLKVSFNKFASKKAFTNMGVSFTFREVDEKSNHVAAYFQQKLGLKKGDRIVIQMPNLLQYPIVLFGAIKAGLVVVNVNPLYTPPEMEKAFIDSGAKAIIIVENFADKLEAVLKKTAIEHVILTEIGDFFPGVKRVITNLVVKHVKKMVPKHGLTNTIRLNDVMRTGAGLKFQPVAMAHDDLVFLQYTGGTTGGSKGAMLTHRNLVANSLQMLEVMKTALNEGQEKVIAALPLYHIFCLTVNCIALHHYGLENILITNPRDVPAFIKTLRQEEPSVIMLVSTLANLLMTGEGFEQLNFKNLKITVAGGMALKSAVAEKWQKITGTKIFEGYGLTETSPVVSVNPLVGNADRLGTIGIPVPSTEVELRDESGKAVPIGEAGEICVRGPQVMKGYWNKPEETKNVFTTDGWLRTGDIAAMDADGFIKIMDRKKDMILVSGFNVYPNEVEDAAMQHPKVGDAAAIGVPDDHSGEVVKLFIVKKDASLTEQEIKTFLQDKLAAYKRPKLVEFRTELPKTNVGKVLRRELR